MEHSFWDKYSNLSSPIHQLSSNLKFAVTLGFIIILNFFGQINPLYFSAMLLILSIIVLVSKIPPEYVLLRSLVIIPFTFFVCVINFLSGRFNLEFILSILFKSYLSIVVLILFSATTPFSDVTKTLKFFKVPGIVVVLLSFLYRYFFVLIDEIYRKRNALILRVEKIKPKHLAVSLADIFVRSYQRSERIYYAMKLRGYNFE